MTETQRKRVASAAQMDGIADEDLELLDLFSDEPSQPSSKPRPTDRDETQPQQVGGLGSAVYFEVLDCFSEKPAERNYDSLSTTQLRVIVQSSVACTKKVYPATEENAVANETLRVCIIGFRGELASKPFAFRVSYINGCLPE